MKVGNGKRKGRGMVICESHQVVDATGELGLTEIRVLQLCLGRVYQGEGIKEGELYEVPLQEYADWFGIDTHSAYLSMVEAAKTLKSRLLTLRTSLIDSKASKSSKTIISWVDRIEYNADDSSLQLEWGKYLIPFLNNFGKDNPYSKYYLENTCKMQSIYSIRLFRVLNKWANVGKLERDIPEMKRLLGLMPEEYVEFDNFKRKVIMVALREINKFSDLDASVSNVTAGSRKVVGLVFDIKRKVERRKIARKSTGTVEEVC